MLRTCLLTSKHPVEHCLSLYLLKLHLVKSGVERLQDERKESAEHYTLFTAMMYSGLSVTFIGNLNVIFNLNCVASPCIHCVI